MIKKTKKKNKILAEEKKGFLFPGSEKKFAPKKPDGFYFLISSIFSPRLGFFFPFGGFWNGG